MLRSTTIRLSFAYLAAIMAVSLTFSFVIYKTSTREIGAGFHEFGVAVAAGGGPGPGPGQITTNRVFEAPAPDVIETISTARLDRTSHRLMVQLSLLNLSMLIGGGLFSYWLARRHLDPLEEAMAAQARFTSDAAHELRTPLTAMKTELEVGLRDKQIKLPAAKELLESNLEEVAKLTTLTNALLRLAQTSDKIAKQNWRTLNLRSLVLDATKQCKQAADQHKMTILADDVHKMSVHGDPDQLREVVVILLDNAIKYGQEGMSIRLETTEQNGTVRLSVTDQGVGIKASDVPHIFDRFYRADQSRSKLNVTGYGLGLSLARTIMEQHGGNITVTSEPSIGSTFTASLPVYQKASGNSQARSAD